MEMKGFKQGAVASVLALFVLTLSAKGDDKLIEKKNAGDPKSDKDFVARAIACDIAGIKFAERAIKQTTNKDVEKFARKMKEEHTKCRDALMERAKEMKLGVLEGLDKEKQGTFDRVSKLEGSEFDRAYMREMVESHEAALATYEFWAEKGKDREVADHVKRAIPKIKEHLEEARRISNNLKP
jgi:putative membrane protein